VATSVAAGLVVYGQPDSTILQMVERIQHLDGHPFAVYVVVNEPARLVDLPPAKATLLIPGSNIGFCGGANLAARTAMDDGHSHLLLVNLDAHVLASDLVTRLLEVFRAHDDCAFASPGITFWPDTSRVWYRGAHVLRPLWVSRHPRINRRWQGGSRGAVRTGYFSGCCALIDLSVFLALRGFDEHLFMYYDEADLAMRAKQQLGRYSYLLDEPMVAHAKPGRKLNTDEAFYHARNSRLLLSRYESGFRRVIGRASQLAVLPPQLLRCDSGAARTAYIAGFRNLPNPSREAAP
jgi:GT2 family glycosyltransferase